MPYNVIIFTSTAIALAFGGMFNIIVRRFVAADEGPNISLRSVFAKLAGRIKGGDGATNQPDKAENAHAKEKAK